MTETPEGKEGGEFRPDDKSEYEIGYLQNLITQLQVRVGEDLKIYGAQDYNLDRITHIVHTLMSNASHFIETLDLGRARDPGEILEKARAYARAAEMYLYLLRMDEDFLKQERQKRADIPGQEMLQFVQDSAEKSFGREWLDKTPKHEEWVSLYQRLLQLDEQVTETLDDLESRGVSVDKSKQKVSRLLDNAFSYFFKREWEGDRFNLDNIKRNITQVEEIITGIATQVREKPEG